MRIHEEAVVTQGKSATGSRAQRILRINQMNLRMGLAYERHQTPPLRIFRVAGQGVRFHPAISTLSLPPNEPRSGVAQSGAYAYAALDRS